MNGFLHTVGSNLTRLQMKHGLVPGLTHRYNIGVLLEAHGLGYARGLPDGFSSWGRFRVTPDPPQTSPVLCNWFEHYPEKRQQTQKTTKT
jgi:hypothetical protein